VTIFKACDVRGVVGAEWDVGEARRIGAALAQMLHHRGQSRIVVGGDFRRSTPRLKEAFISGLTGHSIAVHDVGQAPTPVVQFAARHMKCPNLAIITASHNPGKYNGVKFMVDGLPPVPSMVDELERLCVDRPDSASSIPPCRESLTDDYAAAIYQISRDFVEQQLVKRGGSVSMQGIRPQRVIVDTMGGAFTQLAPSILRRAGHDVISIDDQLDPDFAHRDPNPAVDANLRPLIDAVRSRTADIGLALDGDGDRVIFVDHTGLVARPEQIAAILIRQCLGKCTTVYDLKCASIVARTVREGGGRAVMQPSGHGFIKRKLLELRAELGVEVSGHHFFGALQGGDDGLFTACVLLQLLAIHQQPLAKWLAQVGWPAITPDLRIAYTGDSARVLEQIAQNCGGTVQRLDGVRAEYEDDGWALARASITEPAITFRFEGRDARHMREIAERFLASTEELRQQVMEKIR
jgi:phosphomannomutase/phosphoglucomutase